MNNEKGRPTIDNVITDLSSPDKRRTMWEDPTYTQRANEDLDAMAWRQAKVLGGASLVLLFMSLVFEAARQTVR